MSKVAVITSAYSYTPDSWAVIRESAIKCGMPLHCLGQGQPFPGDQGALSIGLQFIQSLPNEYIMVTDGYDVMVNRWDEDEVVDRVNKESSGLLVSCNDECWPYEMDYSHYPRKGWPWRSACGGQWVGKRASVVTLIQEWLSGKWPVRCGGGNQEMLHRMHEGGYPFGLDTGCRIFQIMGKNTQPYMDLLNGKAHNSLTDTVPMLLHWGGRALGMQEWYERIYGTNIR